MAIHDAAKRDPFIDNAKVILIVLVVVGHLIESIRGSGFSDGVYTWIYFFHMPAFVLVSGYLSRNFTATPRQCRALVTNVIVPYLVIQVVLSFVKWMSNGGEFTLNFFVPIWVLWYLMALAAWRLATPLILSLRHPLITSIAISILSVTFGGIGNELSGARILSFLPFFTLGLIATPEHVAGFKRIAARTWVRATVVLLLTGSLLATYLMHDLIARRWFYMYGRYDTFEMNDLELVVLRAVVLVTSTVLTFAVLAVVPQKRFFLTSLGPGTMYVLVLHAILVYPVRTIIGDWDGWTLPTVLALMVGGTLFALLLATKPVRWATGWLVDPASVFGRRVGGGHARGGAGAAGPPAVTTTANVPAPVASE